MEIIAVVAKVVSAIGSIQQGAAEQEMYNLKAKQATIEGERKAIQYQQRSNDTLRRLQATNSALAARAYAGGVNPFSGSPDIVRAANETTAGREYSILLADADAAMRGAGFQAEIYRESGRQAYQRGVFNAAGKLLGAGESFFGGGSGTQSPAPISDSSVYVS